ncbi:MAG: DUF2190 family protein, partial [Candidatus Peribacteraceae bacterium]|nr:DUF2190 family protein [Candidatus Peribacteraceae bacterium]
ALAITAGATLYWDDTAKKITTTVGANTKCGVALQDAAGADSVVRMELDNSVNF